MDSDSAFDEISRLSDTDDDEFRVIRFPETVDATKPLYLLVHPGDVIQTTDDVRHSGEYAQPVMDYCLSCQGIMATEMEGIDPAVWDIVVLHRFSSAYAFVEDDGVDPDYVDTIRHQAEEGVLLWGDDLKAAARYAVANLAATERPLVVMAGAWSSTEDGCVSIVGRHLEAAGAKLASSTGTCISPDGGGEEWIAAGGKMSTEDILAFRLPAPSP